MKNENRIIPELAGIYLKHAPVQTSLITLLSLADGVLTPVLVYVVAGFLDSAVTKASDKPRTLTLAGSAAVILLAYMFAQTSQLLIRYLYRSIENRLRTEFRPKMVKKWASLDFELLENEKTLDLVAFVFENMESRLTGILSDANVALCMMIQTVGVFSILVLHVWWLAVAFAFVALPLVVLSFKGGAAIYDADKETTMLTRIMNYLSTVLTSRETGAERTLFGYTRAVNEKFRQTHLTRSNLMTKVLAMWNMRVKACAAVLMIFVAVAVVALMDRVSDGSITGGMCISIVGSMIGLFKALSGTLSKLVFNLAGHVEYMRDYRSFLALKGDESVLEHRRSDLPFEYMEIKDLRFRYKDSDGYILKGVSMRIEKGKSYSLVGCNGAGKTTLTKIMTGLYRNYEGEIIVNGRDLREYGPDELRGVFSIVYQDFARYYISLKDNVTLGDRAGDFGEIARQMELGGIMGRLPLGSDNPLGKIYENGSDLSGGEWQKVAIARAVYGNCPFMILDEPTASLSPTMESGIYRKFAEISSGKTQLLISHRLGSTMISDIVFVLDDGVIAENGTHAELMKEKGLYAAMYGSQRSWYDEA